MNNYYCTCHGSDSSHVTFKKTRVDNDTKCVKCGYYAHYGKKFGAFLEKHEKLVDNYNSIEVEYATERTFTWS